MLEGHNIICIASSNWEAMWVNSQHLMSRLARRNRVFYVNNMGLRAPAFGKGRDVKQVAKRLGSWFKGVRKIDDGLWVYDPINIPIYRSPTMRVFNRWALQNSLHRYQDELNLERPILWTFLPTAVGLLGTLNEKLVVYHCVDDYAANPGVSVEQIHVMENELISKADVMFVTSPKLYRDKSSGNRNTHYFGNVANTDHFTKALSGDSEMPEKIRGVPGPIIGYQGNISSYKTDLDLLIKIASKRPEWSLVLVGPTGWGDPTTDIRPLEDLPNVHFTGRVGYDELPNYVKHFDVALIPFRISESTQSSFPMKFFEYLALGKPVVSTALDALQEWGADPDICKIAKGGDEFIELISQSLATNHDAELVEKRQKIARDHDWEKRVDEISAVVAKSMEERE